MSEILKVWHSADNYPLLQYGSIALIAVFLYILRLSYFNKQYDQDWNYRNPSFVEHSFTGKLHRVIEQDGTPRQEKLKNGGVYPRDEITNSRKILLFILIPIFLYGLYFAFKIDAFSIIKGN